MPKQVHLCWMNCDAALQGQPSIAQGTVVRRGIHLIFDKPGLPRVCANGSVTRLALQGQSSIAQGTVVRRGIHLIFDEPGLPRAGTDGSVACLALQGQPSLAQGIAP